MPLVIEMDRYGGPDVLRLQERPAPEPGPGEAVVRVVVAGINRADLFIRAGAWPQGGGWPYVPGVELAGVVAAVGPGVRDFAPGDRVITMMQGLGGVHGTRPGGYQELVRVPTDTLARVPDGLELATAGALGLPAVTAWGALDALDVQPGHRLVVHAASGAVGAMAIQLARARGITDLVATGTRPEKFDFMKACGAQETICTCQEDWPEQVGAADRVLDLVGRAVFQESVALLRPHGRLVFVGGTTGGVLTLSGWDLMKPVTISGWSSEHLTRGTLQRTIDGLAGLVRERRVRVLRLTSYPLKEAAAAHEAIETGSIAGRVVLRPGGAPG